MRPVFDNGVVRLYNADARDLSQLAQKRPEAVPLPMVVGAA